MLTLAAYLGYVRAGRFPSPRYLAVLACFIAGLAAKPMAVTLPLLLLLLDYWPLGRMNDQNRLPSTAASAAGRFAIRRLILEKLPMLAIACLFCLLPSTARRRRRWRLTSSTPLAWRIGNALISYVAYLGQFFCPAGLAPYYPRRPRRCRLGR